MKRILALFAVASAGLADDFTKEEFASAIEGHVLAEAVIEGVYKK